MTTGGTGGAGGTSGAGEMRGLWGERIGEQRVNDIYFL